MSADETPPEPAHHPLPAERTRDDRYGHTRGWASVVAPEQSWCGVIPGSAFGGCSYSHQGKAKNNSWPKTHPWSCCSGTSPAPTTAACCHLKLPGDLPGEVSASLSTLTTAGSVQQCGYRWRVMAQSDQYPPDTRELAGSERAHRDKLLPPGAVQPGSPGARDCLSLYSHPFFQ